MALGVCSVTVLICQGVLRTLRVLACIVGRDDTAFAQYYKAPLMQGDGGLIKKIIKEGSGWETPSKGDDVTVIYHGTLEDGTVFDSSGIVETPSTSPWARAKVRHKQPQHPC